MCTSELDKTLKKIKVLSCYPCSLCGLPCDMKSIKEIADKNDFIIEDAAHALGAKYSCGSKVGSVNILI